MDSGAGVLLDLYMEIPKEILKILKNLENLEFFVSGGSALLISINILARDLIISKCFYLLCLSLSLEHSRSILNLES